MIAIKTYFSGLEENRNKIFSSSDKRTLKTNSIVKYFKREATSSGVSNVLLVQSVYGNEFEIPLLAHVSNLFPIPDGVLIEVPFTESMNTDKLLQNIHGLIPQPKIQHYMYFSLTFHPLNNYRVLKVREQDIEPNYEVC